MPQLKSGFKRTISWNKYTSKLLPQNTNINHLIEPSFQKVNRLSEDDAQRTINKYSKCRNKRLQCYDRWNIPNVEIKDYNVVIDGKNFFDQSIKNNKVTYENIRKIAIGQGDEYTTGCLLD